MANRTPRLRSLASLVHETRVVDNQYSLHAYAIYSTALAINAHAKQMQFQINAHTHPTTTQKKKLKKNHIKTRRTNLNKIQNTKHTKKRTITTATMQQQKSPPIHPF